MHNKRSAMLGLLLMFGPGGAPGMQAFAADPGGTPPSIRATGEKARDVLGFSVRDGYELTLAYPDIPGGRFMEVDERGTLYLSLPNKGEIIALSDPDEKGVYKTSRTIASGYKTVHGLFCRDSWLWFTVSGGIYKVPIGPGAPEKAEVVIVIKPGELPSGGAHWWRSILVTDKYFFTGIGDPGNITDETKTDREKIWRFNLDGTGKTLWSSGLRNTEKLRFRPGTDEVWGVDHGSDNFGQTLGEGGKMQPVTDYSPPDEFNHYVEGGFYGHPFVTGFKSPRYEFAFGKQKRDDILELVDKTIVPEWTFGAHHAASSFIFLDAAKCGPGKGMPASHEHDAFVACRGSWNRTQLAGYCIARVLFDDGHPFGQLNVVSTLSADGKHHNGKPIDCVQAPDGSVLFSIDSGQDGKTKVYRIRYVGDEK